MIVLLLISMSFASTVDSTTRPNPDCACLVEVLDPFEKPVAFNFGKNKGLCIDSCRFRPAHIVEITQAQNQFEVANILHHSLFYKSKIDLSKIDSTEVGFEEFTPGVHHVFLKFNLKPGTYFHLFDQNSTDQKFKKIHSLVISAEGVPARGQDYSLIDGARGQYLFVTRILTSSEHQRWTKSLGNPVKYYRLKLDSKQSSEAFLRAVQSSHFNGANEVYQLLTNNCSTKAYSFFSHLLDRKRELNWLQRISLAVPVLGPISTYSFLKNEELIQ